MTRGSGNVFADLGFDAEEAQNLLLRSQTMMAVEQWYKVGGLTQAKAAQSLGIAQPRLNQLLQGKISEFSLDALVNMATRAGMRGPDNQAHCRGESGTGTANDGAEEAHQQQDRANTAGSLGAA